MCKAHRLRLERSASLESGPGLGPSMSNVSRCHEGLRDSGLADHERLVVERAVVKPARAAVARRGTRHRGDCGLPAPVESGGAGHLRRRSPHVTASRRGQNTRPDPPCRRQPVRPPPPRRLPRSSAPGCPSAPVPPAWPSTPPAAVSASLNCGALASPDTAVPPVRDQPQTPVIQAV